MNWLERPIAVLDVETTGTDPFRDRVVSIALVRGMVTPNGFEVAEAESMSTLVNPQRSIPAEATLVHGITNEMVASAPTIDVVLSRFAPMMEGATPAAFNERFDRESIAAEWLRTMPATAPLWLGRHNCWLDPYLWSRFFRRFARGSGQHKLTGVAASFGIEVDAAKAHGALYDAHLCAKVIHQFAVRRFDTNPERLHRDLADLLEWQECRYHLDRGDLLDYFRTARQKRGESPKCWATINEGATK